MQKIWSVVSAPRLLVYYVTVQVAGIVDRAVEELVSTDRTRKILVINGGRKGEED